MGSTPTHPFRLRLANLCLAWLTVCLATTFAQACAFCQEARAQEARGQAEQERQAQELRQEQIAQRFLTILKRNPRLGTALDRVYSHVATRGKVDEFVDDLVGEGKAGAADSWMVAGLVQLTRGREAEAASCFEAAAQVAPEQSLAHYYLARSRMQLGDSRAAIAAFRRALETSPSRLDALQISTGLGRLLQRLGRKEDADAIWSDLEAKYPGDSQIQREIAQVLAEEGAYDAAIKRYQDLEARQSDPLQRLEFAVKVAELMSFQGRHEEALAGYRGLLALANPGSWVYEDLCRRIEVSFLARADYGGIYQHYKQWIESHPDDLAAVQRAVTFMLRQQAYDEAREILESSLERAPSMTSLRLKLVDVLLADDQTADALSQLEIAAKQTPHDPDLIVQLGQLTWQASEQDDAAREATANIWRRLLAESDRGDMVGANRAFQLAELLASIGHQDAAEFYRRACELSPIASYREQWGNYLLGSGDQEQAIKVWERLATDDSPTSDWVRLSEIYQQHDLTERAIQAMLQACAMQPTLGDRLQCARLLSDAERFSEAIEQIDAALPETLDQTRRLLQLRVSILSQQGALSSEIARASKSPEPDPYYLALLHSANRDVRESLNIISEAIQSGNRQPLLLSLAVERFKAAGRTQEQLSAIEMLAESDANNREGHLKQKARLLIDIGRTDEAFRAAERILVAAPNQKSASQFFAEVCFECGKPDEGIDELRRLASRLYRDTGVVGQLAEALAENGRASDAIEAYWRLFGLQESVADKCDTVEDLAKLHYSLDRVDVLLRRFENFSPSSGADDVSEHSEAALFKAVVYEHTNEHEKAISQIESLLQTGSEDVALLERLVNLAVELYDFEKAAAYQERVARLEPSTQNRVRLADLLSRQGDVAKSGEILSALAAETDDPLEELRIANSLLDAELVSEAEILLNNAIAASPSPRWDLQLLFADVKLRLGQYDDAARIAEAIVALPIPSDTLSLEEQNNSLQSRSGAFSYYAEYLKGSVGRPDRIARVASLISEQYERTSSGGMGSRYFVPQCFADAKIAACKIRLRAAPVSAAQWAEQQIAALIDAGDIESLWTAYALLALQDEEYWYQFGKSPQWDRCVRLLVDANQSMAKAFFAYALMERLKEVDDREEKERLLVEAEDLLVAVVGRKDNDGWPGFLESYLRTLAAELGGSRFVDSASRIEELQLTADQRKTLAVAWATVHRLVNLNEGEDRAQECPDENWQKFLLNMRRSLDDESESSTVSGADFLLEAFDGLEGAINDEQYAELQALLWNLIAQEAKPAASRVGQVFKAESREAIGRPAGQILIPGSGFVPGEAIESLHDFALATGLEGAEEMLQSFDAALSATDLSLPGRHALLVGKVHLQLWCRKTRDALVTLDRIAATGIEPRYPTAVRLHFLLEQKGFSEALALLDQITISNYREAVDREYMASTCLMALGRLDEAKQRIQELAGVRMRPDDLLDLSDRLAQLGLREQATAILDRLSVRSSRDTDMLLELARRYDFAGDRENAVELAKQAINTTISSSSRGNSYYYYNDTSETAVELLKEAGELDSIVAPLEQAYAERPGKGPVADRLITLYYTISRYEDATRIEAEIAAAGGGVEGMVARADELFGKGRFDEALTMYTDAIKQSPGAIELCEYTFLPLVATLGRADVLPELLQADGVPRSVWVDAGAIEILWDSGQHAIAEELLSEQLEEAASLRNVETTLFDWPSEYRPCAELLEAIGRFLVTNPTSIRARNELQQEGLLFPGVWDTSMMRCLDIVAYNRDVNRQVSAEIADTNDGSGPSFVATYLAIARGDYSEADTAFDAWLEAGPGDSDACASLLFCMHKLDSQESKVAAELARKLSLRLFATDADWRNTASQEKLMRFADRHGHSLAKESLVNLGLLAVVESLQSYPEYYMGSVIGPHALQSVAKQDGFHAVVAGALMAHGTSLLKGQKAAVQLAVGAIEPSDWYWQRAIEAARPDEVAEGLVGLVNHVPQDTDSIRLMGEESVSPDYFLREALMQRGLSRNSGGPLEVLLERIAESTICTSGLEEALRLAFANRQSNKSMPTLATRVLIADRLLPEAKEQAVDELVAALKFASNKGLQRSEVAAVLSVVHVCSAQQRQKVVSHTLERLRESGAISEWLLAKLLLSEQFSDEFALDEVAAEELSLMIRGQSGDRKITRFSWEDRGQRIELAFAAVQLAWKFGYKDLSRKLFAETLDWSENLGTTSSAWYEASDKTDISKMTRPILQQWHTDKDDAAANYSFLREIVFPSDNPNNARLVSSLEFNATSEYATFEMDEPARTEFQSLAHWLVEFGRDAGKTAELADLAQDRLEYPGSAAAALVVRGLLAGRQSNAQELIAIAEGLIANPAPLASSECHGSAVRVCVDIVEQLQADGSKSAVRAAEELLELLVSNEASYFEGEANGDLLQLAGTRLEAALECVDASGFEKAIRLFSLAVRESDMSYIADSRVLGYRLAFVRAAFESGDEAAALQQIARAVASDDIGNYWYSEEFLPRTLLDPKQLSARRFLAAQPQARLQHLWEPVCNAKLLGLSDFAIKIPPGYLSHESEELNGYQHWRHDARSISLLEVLMRDAIELNQRERIDQLLADLEQRDQDLWLLAQTTFDLAAGNSLALDAYWEPKSNTLQPLGLMSGGVLPLCVDIAAAKGERQQDVISQLLLRAKIVDGYGEQDNAALKACLPSKGVRPSGWALLPVESDDGRPVHTRWTQRDGAICCEYSSCLTDLQLSQPMIGEFDIRVQVTAERSDFTSVGISLGGIVWRFDGLEASSGIAGREDAMIGLGNVQLSNTWQLRIVRSGNSVQLHVDDRLLHECLVPSPLGSPFLSLQAMSTSAIEFKFLEGLGQRASDSTQADVKPIQRGLLGWLSGPLAATGQPTRLEPISLGQYVNRNGYYAANPLAFTGHVQGGELVVAASQQAGFPRQIRYQRPLGAGDRVTLESHCGSDEACVLVAVGDVAVVADRGDVSLRKLNPDGTFLDQPEHSHLAELAIGVAKEGWNQVSLLRYGTTVQIEVNGVAVGEPVCRRLARIGFVANKSASRIRGLTIHIAAEPSE